MTAITARAEDRRKRRQRFPSLRLFDYPWAVAGLLVVVFFVVLAIFGGFIAPHDPTEGRLLDRLQPPFWMAGGSAAHVLGTDQLGRDVLSQVIVGSRASLAVGFGVVALSGLVGGLLGLVAGYQGGRIDDVLSRLADWTLAFPFLVLAILLMGMLGPGITNLILVLALAGWPHFFRLMRSEVLIEREKDYVEAAMALGKSPTLILLSEIARNVMHTFVVLATIRLGIAILSEASLSFLGFGVPPSVPAWGTMIAVGQDYVSAYWWLSAVPGVAILALVLSVNLLGEGLRDAFDPRMRS